MTPARGNDASVRSVPSLVARTVPVEPVSIPAVLDRGRSGSSTTDPGPDVDFASSRLAWRSPAGASIAALGTSAVCEASGPDRFETVREYGSALFAALDVDPDAPAGARPRLFGGFSFLPASHDGPWSGAFDARFVLPAVQYASTDEGAWLTVTGENASAVEARLARWSDRFADDSPSPERSPAIEHAERTTSRAAWTDQIETVLSRIERGALRKVALAQSLSVTLDRPFSLPETLRSLAERYPECFLFSLAPATAGAAFFGATPERLVSLSGGEIATGALAGSVERGETDSSDVALASALADSEKNNHEHALVVETIREQLEPLSRSVTVGERTIRKLATVQHLFTPIDATLAGDDHVLSVVEALHPTPAVGGLPPDVAAETIRDVEPFDRGWYAGPVGWFDAAGEGTFAVGIRSAVATDATATLFAGNGIVAGSDPDEEWAEVQLKFRPVLDALGL